MKKAGKINEKHKSKIERTNQDNLHKNAKENSKEKPRKL